MTFVKGAVTGAPTPVWIGTSGWSYPSWARDLYAGVPRAHWLAAYAARFDAVEVDASFYRAIARTTYARWRADTPAPFRFAIKGHRYLTHVRRLDGVDAALARQRDAAAALGDKLAAVLWQLPARFARNLDRLRCFAHALAAWPAVRHAIEFRHPSWFDDAVAELLAHYRIANCQSDAADWPRWDAVTTDVVYVRLHGRVLTYESRYDARALRRWADRIERWRGERRTVYVYFDNTDSGHAWRDALRLRALLSR
jgi:uncharacterized protein YecE (DUF72 family)